MSETMETQVLSPVLTAVTPNHVLRKLEEKVSGYNAKLLLHAAIMDSGIDSERDARLDAEQAKSLCLSLIKKGGPAFKVGQSLYKEILQ